MTTAAATAVRSGDRPAPRGAWFIADESPGRLGAGEVWIDAAAMDVYGRGDAAPAVVVEGGSRASWLGAVIRFSRYPGLVSPVTYRVTARRMGPGRVNLGRPYYVLKQP